MPLSARWRWRIRQLRRNPINLAIIAVVALIVGVAIDRGITSDKLTWATLILIIVAVPAIILHELSHGVVAKLCGDDTAQRAGRLTLNPLRHVDPIGSLLVPMALILLGGPGFGWARPVPVTLNRLRHPRNQAIIVSLVGPVTNAVLAAAAAVAVHFIVVSNTLVGNELYLSVIYRAVFTGAGWLYWVGLFIAFFGIVNVFIGIFNLIPVPPLDGAAVLERFIPVNAMPTYYQVRRYFLYALIVVVFFARNLLGWLYFHLTLIWANPTLPH